MTHPRDVGAKQVEAYLDDAGGRAYLSLMFKLNLLLIQELLAPVFIGLGADLIS